MIKGKNNSITDVPGVRVGHVTLADGDTQTGVTAILPTPGDWFNRKLRGACHVINGFGKSIGLTQLEELRTIETPILLTNTLSAPIVAHYLIQYMLDKNESIGGPAGTVNPIVCECNDGRLNNIRQNAISKDHVYDAINKASQDFARGAVGAGRGMSCYQMKGGIGTSSVVINIGKEDFTLGALVLTNMGLAEDFIPDGKKVKESMDLLAEKDNGSIIIILATDLPLDPNQLKRVAKRAVVGLSRTGTYIGHGSGDIAIAFTSSDPVTLDSNEAFVTRKVLHDNHIDEVFKGVAITVEAAIRDSLDAAVTLEGFKGLKKYAYKDIKSHFKL